MEKLFIILCIVISASLVLATAYFLINKFLTESFKNDKQQISLKNAEVIAPLQIQAYERLVLFLERISPNIVVIRVHQKGMGAIELQQFLLRTIREEYEHNLAQQLYVSNEVWEAVKIAKEETIRMINLSASNLKGKATGVDLSFEIFNKCGQLKKLPSNIAIEVIKKEFQGKFN